MGRELEARTSFAERYRLLVPLGEGAMGEVWRVLDERDGRTLALKLLKEELSGADHLERFRREFRAAARLDHPHCVRCYEQGMHQGRAYFTMELVEGEPLRLERWARPEAVVDLARQLLAGLDHIHSRGIVHRDLKPQNIFVEAQGERLHARVGDFGIVKVADFRDEGLGLGDVLGSLRFLAPETLEHGMADPRSDLYSLGMILFCLLAGEHPLGSGRRSAREWLHLHRQQARASLVRADVPPELASLVERLCQRRPDARPSSAAAAFDLLEQVRARMGPFPWSRPPPLQRRPYLAAPAFVGRDAELERARRFCAAAREGTTGPCVFFVEGSPGLGKSRLMREVLAEVYESEGLVLTSTCKAEGGSIYLPLHGLLHELEISSSADDDSQGSISPTLEPELASMRSAVAEDPTIDVGSPDEPTLVRADRSPSSSAEHPPSSPAEEAMVRVRVHERLTTRLFELCSQRPVLVVVDDAQWADVPSLQLLGSMARMVALMRDAGQRWPVGFVLTHRPVSEGSSLHELRESVASCRAGEAIELRPLAREAARAVVASMLMVEPAEVPASLAEPLLAKAEGSPLFLAQILRLLLGKGLLAHDQDGRWRLDDAGLESAGLPASVVVAIGERAARLATTSKQLLAAAAVVGRRFDVDAISAMMGSSDLALLDGLDELVRGEFIEDAPGGFRFVHDRIRESILDGLEPSERVSLHRAAAVVLQERAGSQVSAWPALAHHFEEAGEHARAHHYALQAAAHAGREHAHGASAEMYALAVRTSERDESIEVSSSMWERYGDAQAALGRYAEAVECYQRRVDDEPGPAELRVVLSKVGDVAYKQGRFVRAVRAMEQVLALAGFRPPSSTAMVHLRTLAQAVLALLPARAWRGSPEDGEARARSCALAAESWYFSGDQPRATYYSLLSANTARRVGPSPGSVRALSGFGYVVTTLGLHRLGERITARAQALADRTKLPPNDACWLEVMRGLNLATMGRTADSLAVLDAASRSFGNSANAEARLLSMINHALIRVAAGRDYPRAERLGRQLHNFAEETNDVRAMGWGGEARGQLALRRDRLDEGLQTLRQAAERCVAANDVTFASSVNDTLALFLGVEGEHEEALARGHEAAELVLRTQVRHFFPVDGGLVIAAALTHRRGEPPSPATQALVRRILRRRPRVVRASRLTRLRLDLGVQAWRAAHGRSADFDRVVVDASRLGLLGEAWVAHRVAAAFDSGERARHLQAMRELGRGFERG